MIIESEYARFPRRNRERIALEHEADNEMSHIKVVGRLRGRQWWQCRGGSNYDGHGESPAKAYEMWCQTLFRSDRR